MSQRLNFNTECFQSILILWLHPLDFRNPIEPFTNNRLYAKILVGWLKEFPTVFLTLNSLLAFRYLKKQETNLGQPSRSCSGVDRSEMFFHKNKEGNRHSDSDKLGRIVSAAPCIKTSTNEKFKVFFCVITLSQFHSVLFESMWTVKATQSTTIKSIYFFTSYRITANLRTVPQ